MPLKSINPATEEIIAEFAELKNEEINEKIAIADVAYESWRSIPYEQRAEKFANLSLNLKNNSDDLAALIVQEMGKPFLQAKAEVEKCAWVCEYYSEQAKDFLKPRPVDTDAGVSYIKFEPLGIVFAIMPWNFPFWQVIRFAAPTLMAGNVALLKHASNVQQCAQAIEALFVQAGFPAGAFQNLAIGADKTEQVIADDRISAVTLTGSENAGSSVASQAGKHIKKTVLELGGSDPFIVLGDADIELAAEVATTARLQSNGQSCIAAKRFIVNARVAEEFTEKLKINFEKQVIGSPLNEDTTIGPVVSEKSLKDLLRQIEQSIAKGAVLVTGGKRYGETGYFLEPTIVSGVSKDMPLYNEEAFGPVAAVIVVSNDEEAVEVANDTKFGLGSSIWTADIEKAKILANKIKAGSVFINGMVKSDPRLPFGGTKKSGYGRELSEFGIHEFVNVKTIWIK